MTGRTLTRARTYMRILAAADATLGAAVTTAAVAGLLATACIDRSAGAPGSAEAVSARDSAGVRIVEHGAADRAIDVEAVMLRELTTPDSALTAVPWGVVASVEAGGPIWIVDWRGARVAAFDGAGAYLRSIGRAGDGPGEFRNPAAAALDADGVLTVWDAGRGVLSRWSADGALLDERRAPLPYWGPGLALGRDRLVTVTSTTSGMVMEQSLIAHSDDGVVTLHEVPLELSMMRLPCATMPAPKVFAPSVTWTARADTVYVLAGPEYRIDVLVEDATVASLRRAVRPIPVTSDLAVAGVESGPGPYGAFLRRCGVTARELAEAPVQSLALDPAGRLWVTRTADGVRPSLIDVFDADGAYAGTFASDVVPVTFVTDSTFVGLHVEETGRATASLYALRPAAPFAAWQVPAASIATPAPDATLMRTAPQPGDEGGNER
jgi:hypothetical protein